MTAHQPVTIQPVGWPEVQVCELDREPWPCPASRKAPPEEVTCPKCGMTVGTEVTLGRRRKVTTTKVHIKPGPAAVVCHAILKTEERQ